MPRTMTDPLAAVRTLAVDTGIGVPVYATPLLPPDHTVPCVQLANIGSQDYAPVALRHSYTALIQLSVWSQSQEEASDTFDTLLSALVGVPPFGAGITQITVSTEGTEIDEERQPPLHRYRADLLVRVGRTPQE